MNPREPGAGRPGGAGGAQLTLPRIVDFEKLFKALDEATLCLPHADHTTDADVLAVGLRLQAVRIEALRLYRMVMAERITRRSVGRKRR